MVNFPNFDIPKDLSGASDLWDSDAAGVIISEDFFEIAIVGSPLKRWNGSSWVEGSLKQWNGSSWQNITLKRFNGSTWV